MNENIKKSFRKNGYNFKLIRSSYPYAIYELSVEGGIVRGYEVHKLRKSKERYIKERKIEAGIKYPSNEDFGECGWSYQDLEDAEAKYNKLMELESK